MQRLFKTIPITALHPGRYQPRKVFDSSALEELAASIKTQGLIEPLIVQPSSKPGQYEIIAGERRFRAALLAGVLDVPCLIGAYSNEQAAAVTLIENIQRADLGVLEEAMGYQRLLDEFGFTQADVAQVIGKSRSHVANVLRLLTLSDDIQQLIQHGALSSGHARLLVGLPITAQQELAQKAIQSAWSVRQMEEAIRQYKRPASVDASTAPFHQDIKHLEQFISEQMGTPINITLDNSTGGWLNIKFFNHDTLSGLLEKMGLRYD